MIKKTLKSIFFLLNVFFILFTEFSVYCIFRDYSLFIDRLTMRLSLINILYVKVFQAFALNNSLIDDKINNKLLEFTDNAPWNYSDIDLYTLIEMSDKYNIELKKGYEVPINAGMISVVFKGYERNNNKPVIIKMKRNNIQKKLNDAIDNLLFTVKILSLIPFINKYQIHDVINKNIDIIRHQTNFLEEVNNMEKIKENCRNLKYVKIPTVNRKVTEEYSNVIVMEYIDGIKIDKIEKEDYDGFAKQIVKFGLVTTLIHGCTHGDLHSGNILFIKDKNDPKYPHKIGIIDFGIIYDVKSEYKSLMFDIFTKIYEISPRESAERILNSGVIDPPGILKQIPKDDYDNIITFLADILDDTINNSKSVNQVQIYKFLSMLKEYLSKKEMTEIGIRPSDDFIKSQLVLAMAHGVTLKLCKDDFIALMDSTINELFHTKMLF